MDCTGCLTAGDTERPREKRDVEKFCIFCGERPESKTKEHIIPRWLIELTGDPKRVAGFGIDWRTPTKEGRQFSFDSFAFPACWKCNDAFSALEASAKPVLEAILSEAAISAADWDTFLDWIDKVRTGLWLGMLYLNRNWRGITPRFHVATRTGAKDRVLITYRLTGAAGRGLRWLGTESPLFQDMPSCFVMMVKNYLFFSLSCDFLLAERLGLPYPGRRSRRAEGGEWVEMCEGTGQLKVPLPPPGCQFKTGGTQLYQPTIPRGFFAPDAGGGTVPSHLYDSEYVRSVMMDYQAGKGLVFRRAGLGLQVYPSEPTLEWRPKQTFEPGPAVYEVTLMAFDALESLYSGYAALDCPDDERAEATARNLRDSIEGHRLFRDLLVRDKWRFRA